MAIRIRKLSLWQLLETGKVLEPLIDTAGRKVTVWFNTEQPARIGWVAAGGRRADVDVLLGTIHGHDSVEFRPPGPGVLTVQSEGQVWFYTDDGESTVANDGSEQEPYTRLLEPKDRNQQLEEIIIRQQAAHNRRMKQQEAERVARDARIAALEAELAAQEAANGENAGGVVAGAEPQADGGAGGDSVGGQATEGGTVPAAK